VQQGKYRLSLLSDGTARFDAGAAFGVVPKALWIRRVKPDRRNRVTFGLNCLLIQGHGKNILVDTGIGPKEPLRVKEIYGFRTSGLVRDLRGHGLTPKDIDLVILTHLHFDHCGGNTYTEGSVVSAPTFPRAKYLVQREAWDEATHPNERTTAAYHQDDFLPIFEGRRLELVDGDAEVLPGIHLLVTNGHSRGHQVVKIESAGTTALFSGDLIPTPHHLPLPYIAAFDLFPLESMERKRELLAQAEEERWLLVFGHGHEVKAGYLQREQRRLELKRVELP